MKLSVEFPSVAYREGPDKVAELARNIEEIGYDELAVFDHVVMGFPNETRATMYPAQMPILEAFMMLAYAAAVTERVSLATEVLVLPQRQPVLAAKQVQTLDTLSDGRVRLGVGVGWQDSEYDALEEDFSNRGKRMDECIDVLRAYWGQERPGFQGEFYDSVDMGMEPKSPQGADLPIWIGGGSRAALRRTAERGDGWMASAMSDDAIVRAMGRIRSMAEEAGREPSTIGMQAQLAPPPRTEEDKNFYKSLDTVAARAAVVAEQGFDWTAVNATAIFQAGARSVDAISEELRRIHDRIRSETS